MAAPTVTTGILTGGSNSHATSSEEVNAIGTDFVSEGIVGTITNTSGVAPATGGFAINAAGTPDTTVAISTGVAYVTATPTSQNSQALRAKCSVSGTLTISANASGSTKYDWIYISVSAANAANPNSAADNVATIVASRSSSASTDDGTPPTYGYPLAVVTVANGFSTITNGNIRDIRTNAIVNLGSSSVSSGWLDLGYTPNTVTALGNRSYSLVFNSTNLTTTLSNGMRLRSTRITAAPNQCTSLNGTNQYYSKTSPAAMTFTDDFTVSAWIKLNNYGATSVIASRYNGTSGWSFYISSDGRVNVVGYNAAAANFSGITSYQSVPIGKWVHVAAQLDMSAFTATTTTSYVMTDGLDTPSIVSRGGTNPTALVQAGNLEIGSNNAGASPFPGKIAQVAIYNAKVLQATVLASISQGLGGSETSLISAYSFNNSINDLSANANNLTANGSAVATNADSPFGGQADGTISTTLDYGIITKTAFSTNTTLTVQIPEGCTIPTSGGVSAISYSTQEVPYLLPTEENKWAVESIYRTQTSQGSATTGTWYNIGHSLTVPIGPWNLGYEGGFTVTHAGTTFLGLQATLSTANNTDADVRFRGLTHQISSSLTQVAGYISRKNPIANQTAATIWYLNLNPTTSSSTVYWDAGSASATIVIRAAFSLS